MATKPANVHGNVFKSVPPQLKEKALHRFLLGESATAIAKSMGLNPSTVARWAKKEGVERGGALSPEANPMIVPKSDQIMDAFTTEVRKQNVEAALNMFLQMQDGVEDKYRVLMAQQLYQVFHQVMQNPPPIRNWQDAERAHRIMGSILGFNKQGASSGGGATKLHIQFDVLKGKPTVIDADVVDAETLTDDGDDGDEFNSGD